METLKKIRKQKQLTQQQVASMVGLSLRSYKTYENDPNRIGTIKYNYIMERLLEIDPIDEEHGIIDVEYIQNKCRDVFDKYKVDYCYLFGSYSKNKAKPTSDVDLLVASEVSGLQFYGMVEEIRTALHKRVDVLDVNQLKDNFELIQEILKDGIKIYG